MKHECVYYIQPSPYYHDLSLTEISNRFMDSSLGKKFLNQSSLTREIFLENVLGQNKSSKYNMILELYPNANNKLHHIEVSKKIMFHIREYLYYIQKGKRKTLKCLPVRRNRTRKRL